MEGILSALPLPCHADAKEQKSGPMLAVQLLNLSAVNAAGLHVASMVRHSGRTNLSVTGQNFQGGLNQSEVTAAPFNLPIATPRPPSEAVLQKSTGSPSPACSGACGAGCTSPSRQQ